MDLINLQDYPVRLVLRELLQDKTTKQNIMFATDAYTAAGITPRTPITVDLLLGMNTLDLQPRVLKSMEEQNQRTRQKAEVFTPSWICNKMNNNCDTVWFGRENVFNTEVDLYMKSGLYITEIVKRLYQSEEMKKQFPDNKERLEHIFAHQVYGLAPTEIIYKIATNYILGFADGNEDIVHNFRQLDALPYAQNGTLQEKLDELFDK